MLASLRRGAGITAALLLAGIPSATAYEWLYAAEHGVWRSGSPTDPSTLTILRAFRDSVARTQAEIEVTCQETLLLAGRGRQGETDWRAHHEYLKHSEATRSRWREQRELKIEHRGEVSHEHRLVREMDDTQLLELASPELAGLLDG